MTRPDDMRLCVAVLRAACKVYGVRLDHLRSHRRSYNIARARFTVALILREVGFSWDRAGKVVGRADTTLITCVPAFEARITRDLHLYAKVVSVAQKTWAELGWRPHTT